MSKHKPKSTIGSNPLDALMPAPRPRAESPAVRVRPKKLRVTFHLTEALYEELRDAVVALSGPPHRLTLAGLAEIALREKVETLKKTNNKGKPFPKRTEELRGGRPIGS